MGLVNNETQERIMMYPATGVHSGVTDIMYAIGNYVLKAFPVNFFKSIHYNTKDGFYSQYFRIKNSRLRGQNIEFTQQKRPRLVILYDDRSNSTKDTGLGDVSPFKYPMSQGIHPDMHEYEYFYNDNNGITLYTNDKRVRINIEIIAETNSISDQEDVLAYLENRIKVQYGTNLYGINAKFILPNHMINFVRDLLYYNNIVKASSNSNEIIKKELYDEIDKEFTSILYKNSGKGIVRAVKKRKDGEDVFYLLDRIYNKIYIQIESPPEKSDGDRKGEVYDKFSVNMSGFFEYYKPFTYIVKTPDIVCGHLVNDIVKVSNDKDNFLNTTPTGYIPYHRKINNTPEAVQFYLNDGWKMFYKELEFLVDEPKDHIDILDWLNDKKFHGRYSDYISYIKTLTNDQFLNEFHIMVYQDTTPKDKENLMYDRGILYMSQTTSALLHHMYIVYKPKQINYKIKLLKDKGLISVNI
jgi:hypothetical protein